MIIIGVIAGQAGRPQLTYTYSANTTNAALTMSNISGYVSGKSDITITINSGIYVYSTSTGTPGLALTGGASGDTVKIVNNGFILGKGGATAAVGGTALSLSFNTTVDNTNAGAYIGGGGGGGGKGDIVPGFPPPAVGGGGAGSGGGTVSPGATGGLYIGGMIIPGTGSAGETSGAGSGAGGKNGRSTGCGSPGGGGAGGSGSSAGVAGTASGTGSGDGGGGGGGWGATGGNGAGGAGGGGGTVGFAGGKAVALNAKTITWTSGNTTRVYGTVS